MELSPSQITGKKKLEDFLESREKLFTLNDLGLSIINQPALLIPGFSAQYLITSSKRNTLKQVTTEFTSTNVLSLETTGDETYLQQARG